VRASRSISAVEDALHALETHHHAARRRQCPADIAGTGAARHQRQARVMRDAHQRRHLVVTARKHHRARRTTARAVVARIQLKLLRRGQRARRAEQRAQRGQGNMVVGKFGHRALRNIVDLHQHRA
jgi:hypothetical protein